VPTNQSYLGGRIGNGVPYNCMTARKKILIVDDSPTVLLMERMLLQPDGYDFITAKDGQEAIRKAEAEHPDLILMDVMMPGVGGFDACKHIRQNGATADIRIIMVTTRSEAPNVQCGYESGCDDYVTKPIDGLELAAKVRNLLT